MNCRDLAFRRTSVGYPGINAIRAGGGDTDTVEGARTGLTGAGPLVNAYSIVIAAQSGFNVLRALADTA